MLPEKKETSVVEKGPEITYTGKRKRLFRARAILIAAAVIVIALIVAAEIALAPKICLLAETEAKSRILAFLNETVENAVQDGRIRYRDLAKMQFDTKGELTAVRCDTGALNRIAASIASELQEKLDEEGYFKVRLPLSSLWGGYLFAGHGVPVSVRIVPVGSITGEIESRAETQGINQTRHTILLKLSYRVELVLPGKDGAIEGVFAVPLCENIFLGKVPQILYR